MFDYVVQELRNQNFGPDLLVFQLRTTLMDRALPISDQARIMSVCAASYVYHDGQLRGDGSQYIVHPIRVARLAGEILDREQVIDGLCAALMHDLLEDTEASAADIRRLGGSNALRVVEVLTTKPDIGESNEDRRVRKTTKWERVSKSDWMTRVIHCCDVLDNLIAARFIAPDSPMSPKVPRWMMQADKYQLPIATSTDASLSAAIREEIDFHRQRGVAMGSWFDG